MFVNVKKFKPARNELGTRWQKLLLRWITRQELAYECLEVPLFGRLYQVGHLLRVTFGAPNSDKKYHTGEWIDHWVSLNTCYCQFKWVAPELWWLGLREPGAFSGVHLHLEVRQWPGNFRSAHRRSSYNRTHSADMQICMIGANPVR